MKKFVGLAALVAALALLASPAYAQLQGGTNEGGFDDWGSFFSDAESDPTTATPLPVIYWDSGASMVQNAPTADTTFDRTVLKVQTLINPANSGNTPYYTGTPELVGMIYDLVVTDVRFVNVAANGTQTSVANDGTSTIHFVEVTLADGPRWDEEGYVGGRVDFWVDPANDLSMSTNPPSNWGAVADPDVSSPDFALTSWFLAGNHDTFPTVTDGTAIPFLTGTLVAPQPASSTLLTLRLWVQDDPSGGSATAGSGSSTIGFIDVLDDTAMSGFEEGTFLGGLAEIQFQNTFTFWPDFVINGGVLTEPGFDRPSTANVWWDTKSDDPAFFSISAIPEPSSMTLLGMGLVGLFGAIRRRRRK